MSVFDRLAPLIPQVSTSCRQTQEPPKVCLSPPHSLSSPVIKKKAIQIPSFNEKGLISQKDNKKQSTADRSFDPISSCKTSLLTKNYLQRNQRQRASTLPSAKPKTCSSQWLSVKPSLSIFPTPKPNSSPTLPTFKLRSSDSLHLPSSQLSELSMFLHDPEPKLRVSPTLTVPSPRLSPSPTSLCQGMNSGGQGGMQASPVPKERQARSIAISNIKVDPPKVSELDILDQETLLDFTHTGLRRFQLVMSRETQHQTYSESHRPSVTSQSLCLSTKDKQRIPPRNTDITGIPKPKSSIKQQQGFQSSGAAHTQASVSESDRLKSGIVVRGESQSAFDGLSAQPSFERKCADHPQKSNYTQMSEFASSLQSCERLYSEKRGAVPLQSQPAVSPNIGSTRRLFDSHNETREEATILSGCHHRKSPDENNIKSSQRLAFTQKSQSTQMNRREEVSHSECVSKDYSCQSRGIDLKTEASRCAHRSNPLKTCLVAPQSQEASRLASVESSNSRREPFSKLDPQSKRHYLDLEQNNAHKGSNARDAGLNKIDTLAPPGHHVLPTEPPEHSSEEYVASWAPSMAHCPFSTTGPGIHSKRVYQRPEETNTASLPPDQLKNHAATDGRAFFTEDPEDPYYVTMYYPGSIYVDMSDVVPPEVRPKPAVPAKPPNVGVPSPSSPFPPQVPSVGGGSIGGSAPPPSAIPVPIGSHGPAHSASHGLGHGVGHGVSHAPPHPTAHSGGHGHGGSHASSGGSTLLGYIGIDTIIEQMRKKTMKTGFDFNIMVVGHSGLGKSTLMNTLFKSQVSRRSAGWGRDEKIPKTVEIKSVSHVIEEGGVKMKLTVVDTPGFGDQINNDNCWEPISKYINEQFEKFLKEEVNITRKKRIPDTRVHCCLYFIPPTGHSLRQLDMEFMKRLSHSVNIIPVIAKADTMTIEERQEFKQRVRKELEMSGIEFYPQKEFDDDMEDKSDNDKIRETMPFAVVGSDKEYQVNAKRVLGRKTAWGIIEVENPNHCEFAQLRDFLIRSHLQDLKEVTHNIHYETYRAKRLNDNGGLHPISSNDTQESNL